MAEQVKVTSIDSLESFRSSVIVFMTRARVAIDQASDEARRTRTWVETDQRVHWEGQVKRRRKVLEQAEGELMSARMSEFIDSLNVQQQAVRKAKVALDEAEEKLRKVKAWSRDFDRYADPMVRKLDSLRHYIDHVMPKSVLFLAQVRNTLEAYAEIHAPISGAEAPPAENPEPPPA
jgi:hypothetical protein